jgi:Mobilization protein NikA
MEQHHWRVDEVATQEGTIGIVKEHDLAEQIEATRDDAETWGEPSPGRRRKRKSERRKRGALVSVRFSPGELASVQAHAADAGTSVSGYLRNLALAAARQPIVTMTWVGAATINAAGTEERFLVREDHVPAWLYAHQIRTK